jgi:hypothetical protein
MTMGIVDVDVLTAFVASGPRRQDDVDAHSHQFGREAGQAIGVLRPPGLDTKGPSLDPAKLAQLLRQGVQFARLAHVRWRPREQHPQSRDCARRLGLGG